MHSLEPSSHQKRRKPCFFKFFFPSITDKQLEVPKAFLKHFDGDYCGTVSLKGPTGKIWHVNLTEKSNGVFLISGWQTFVKDHAIQVGSCLVFRYYGNFQFKVTILDTSACEKMDIPHVSDPIDHENNEKENIGEKKGNKFSKTYSFREACDGNVVCQHPGDGHSVLRPVCKKGEELGQQNWEKPFYKTRRNHSLNNFVEKSFKKYRVGVCHRCPYISQRRPVSNEEIKRAQKAAKSFTSRYPTTLMVMRKAYVYFGSGMALPRGFVRSSLPKVSLPMKLYDPNGKAWNIKYIYSDAYGSGSIGAGWSSFTFANNIEEHDVCVFEVISRNKMQVHIFRVVDEIAPLLKYSKRSKKCADLKDSEEVEDGEEEDGEVEDCNSFTSKNPFFVRRMTEAHVEKNMVVALPALFRKNHLPCYRTDIVLQVPNRRSWKVRYICSSPSLLSAGWSAFSRDNNLKVGDICIFEFVSKLKLQVHIFRGKEVLAITTDMVTFLNR